MSETKPSVNEGDVLLAGHQAREARLSVAHLARSSPAVFAQYVYRDERGDAIEMADMHIAWHGLMSKHSRLVLWSHMGSGKTTQLSILRVLWEIGRNPNLRVLILSATVELSKKIASAISTYIESSDLLHEVFPDLLPTVRTTEPWQPLSGRLTVRRPNFMKDATVTAAGIGTHILGARYDLVILDDVVSLENSRTKEARKWVVDWIATNAQSRMTAKARMWVIGTAFHPEDVLHHYGALFTKLVGELRAFKYPVLEPGTNAPRWPEVWPAERIERERALLHPTEFARQYLCEARDDAAAIFKRDWIDVAVKKGADRVAAGQLDRFPPGGAYTVTGVDLAVSKKDSADLTAIVSIMVYPPGPMRPQLTFDLLEVKSGRWYAQEIIDMVADAARRFGSIVFVENNGAQDYLVQMMQQVYTTKVQGITTDAKKLHPEYGVQRIATEMYRGQWSIPSKGGLHPEMQALYEDMLYYDPKAHTGDRLMALYIARQGADIGEIKAEQGYFNMQTR